MSTTHACGIIQCTDDDVLAHLGCWNVPFPLVKQLEGILLTPCTTSHLSVSQWKQLKKKISVDMKCPSVCVCVCVSVCVCRCVCVFPKCHTDWFNSGITILISTVEPGVKSACSSPPGQKKLDKAPGNCASCRNKCFVIVYPMSLNCISSFLI